MPQLHRAWPQEESRAARHTASWCRVGFAAQQCGLGATPEQRGLVLLRKHGSGARVSAQEHPVNMLSAPTEAFTESCVTGSHGGLAAAANRMQSPSQPESWPTVPQASGMHSANPKGSKKKKINRWARKSAGEAGSIWEHKEDGKVSVPQTPVGRLSEAGISTGQ